MGALRTGFLGVAIGAGVSFLFLAQSARATLARSDDTVASRVEHLERRLSAVEADLSTAATRAEVAALAARITDEGELADYERAVELGIVRRFSRQANSGLTPAAERRAAIAVVREARKNELDPLLIASVIEIESTYRNFAVSSAGAIGLMQIMPETGRWLGQRGVLPPTYREQLFDPDRNIELGTAYLASLRKQFGSLEHALLAYNAGPARAKSLLERPSSEGLLAYAHKVLAVQRDLQTELARR